MRTSPAVVPAALLVLLCAWAPDLRPVPAWGPLGLAAGGLALGGRAAAALLAAAAGLWLGDGRRIEEPVLEPGLVAETEGQICGPWRERREIPGPTARLCADWLRVGGRLLRAPPRLAVDLPARLEPPPFGATIRVRGTLSRFSGLANATPVPPGPWRLRIKAAFFVRVSASPGAFAQVNARLRRRIDEAVEASGAAGRPGVALAEALVLGDESGFDEGRRRALRRTGLAHLFAVSGFNLTVVAALAGLVAGAGPFGARLLLPGAAVVGYLVAVGPEPSMLRASVMTGLGLAILGSGRPRAALQALAVAAALLAALRPDLVDEIGFQLSFGATAGLIVGASEWAEPARRLPAPLAAALAASFAAQLGALPFSLAAFGEIAPLAPIANLAAVPWAAVWMLVGMAWLAVAVASPPLAGRLAPALDLGAAPFAWLDALPPSPWISSWMPGGVLAGAAVVSAAALLFARRRGRRTLPLVLLALLADGGPRRPEILAEVSFLDVGQGDAAIVRTPSLVVLVDGGGLLGRDLGSAVLRPALARRGLGAVDVAILSHSDRDHCRGLIDLTATTPIGELWSSAGQLRGACGAELARRIAGAVRVLAAGDVIERGGVRFEILHPESHGPERGGNAESLVVAVALAGSRFLFAGDLAAVDELGLAQRNGETLVSTVLKVAHHGAASSSHATLLTAARPRWAVLSVGARNPYGHPGAATLARLRGVGAKVLRTDRHGEIVFTRRARGPWTVRLPSGR